MRLDPAIIAIACAASAAIFAGSATMKFSAPMEFRGAVENYDIVPEWIAGMMAWVVPMLELAGAVGLMMSATRDTAAALLLTLVAIFTAAITINLARGRRDIDCGCFGPMLRQRLSGWLVLRNAALALLLVMATVSGDARPLIAFDYATIVSGVAATIILYAAANYLLSTAPTIALLRTRDA
jgi:uncharacterized membrane protein